MLFTDVKMLGPIRSLPEALGFDVNPLPDFPVGGIGVCYLIRDLVFLVFELRILTSELSLEITLVLVLPLLSSAQGASTFDFLLAKSRVTGSSCEASRHHYMCNDTLRTYPTLSLDR